MLTCLGRHVSIEPVIGKLHLHVPSQYWGLFLVQEQVGLVDGNICHSKTSVGEGKLVDAILTHLDIGFL